MVLLAFVTKQIAAHYTAPRACAKDEASVPGTGGVGAHMRSRIGAP
jgi:hypothetical protein